MSYTPKKTLNYETLLKQLFIIKYPRFQPTLEPIKIDVYALMQIPKSTSKKKRLQMLNGEIYCTKKPDKDNIEKIAYDSLQDLAFVNDSQIVTGEFWKWYSETPKLVIVISEISGRREVQINV